MNQQTDREPEAQADEEVRRRYALVLGGLVVIQLVLGYEWFISGLSKLVRGGFTSGLAEELTEKSEGMYGWYWSFLDWLVIPRAEAWGYLIMWGELLIAIVLVGAALAWLLAADRLSPSMRIGLLGASALAAFAGLVLNLVFHLANGSSHPWLLANDPFDEGVDLDMLMVLLEIPLIVISVALIRGIRRRGSVLVPNVGPPTTPGA